MIDEAKAAIAAAKSQDVTLRPRAFVWVQGESDANAKDAAAYAANLSAMLKSLRTELAAPDLILLIGVNTRFGNGKNAFMPKVVEAQKEVAAALPRARYVDNRRRRDLAALTHALHRLRHARSRPTLRRSPALPR
ncbi:hypothetical protein EMGBS6_12070 [Opitutia bacterium]|nr:hypothetical protein EMGBS6_12070 [Opitutae bacterium]